MSKPGEGVEEIPLPPKGDGPNRKTTPFDGLKGLPSGATLLQA
jgi:hypothetical protein